MAYATVTIPGDGSTTLITASFAIGVIKDADVKIRVTGEVDGGGDPIYRTYTKVGTDQYNVDGTPAPIGQFYVAERRVDKEGLIVDWEDGDAITEENLNTSQKQSLMVAQEALDQANFAYKTIDNSQGGTITKGTEGQTLLYDANGNLVPGFTGDQIAAAQGFAEDAEASAVQSANSASASANSANTASSWSTKASQWSDNAEDVPVVTGPNRYSAFHWAQKALAAAAANLAGLANAIHTSTLKDPPANDDEFGIADSASSWSLKKITLRTLRKYIGDDYIKDLITVRTSATRVTVGAGEIRMNSRFAALTGTLAKDINATWAAGNAVGGMEATKTVAATTTYHLHALINTTTFAFEWMYSPDVNPANIPAGYAWIGRFWSVYTNASSQIVQYTQVGNECFIASATWFSTGSNLASALYTIPVANPVPAGIKVKMHTTCDTLVNGSSQLNTVIWDADGWAVGDDATGTIRIFGGVGGVNASDQNSAVGKVQTTTARQAALQVTFAGTGSSTVRFGGWEDYTLPRIY